MNPDRAWHLRSRESVTPLPPYDANKKGTMMRTPTILENLSTIHSMHGIRDFLREAVLVLVFSLLFGGLFICLMLRPP